MKPTGIDYGCQYTALPVRDFLLRDRDRLFELLDKLDWAEGSSELEAADFAEIARRLRKAATHAKEIG